MLGLKDLAYSRKQVNEVLLGDEKMDFGRILSPV